MALADPEALTTIATNLQHNAERHRGGAAIHWSTVAEDALVGLRCHDEGPGISPEDLPHLFERFYRAGDAEDGGFGLGLPIARDAVQALGGTIEVLSRSGEGTTVRVSLPTGRPVEVA